MTDIPVTEDLRADTGPDGIGRILLNRPRALNALTLPMVQACAHWLSVWADDASVSHVLIRGAGDRGLCAGGDIRALHDAIKGGDSLPERFFRAEYTLNAQLARYAKPVVAIMDGTVMGGGIGISAHGSCRVVTERSVLAMPETAIGFVTDVGATYLLSRAPGELGTHLGLTGTRLSGADAIHCGLADLFVPSARLGAACDDLDRLESYAKTPPPSTLATQRHWIDRCYGFDTIEAILAALDDNPDPAAQAAAATMRTMSPTSLKVTLRALREARTSERLESCLAREFGIAMTMMRPDSDFVEGVRAVLIDKDRTPHWQPATLDAVTDAMVAGHFAPPAGTGLAL